METQNSKLKTNVGRFLEVFSFKLKVLNFLYPINLTDFTGVIQTILGVISVFYVVRARIENRVSSISELCGDPLGEESNFSSL